MKTPIEERTDTELYIAMILTGTLSRPVNDARWYLNEHRDYGELTLNTKENNNRYKTHFTEQELKGINVWDNPYWHVMEVIDQC